MTDIYRVGVQKGKQVIILPKSEEFLNHKRAIVTINRLQRLMPTVHLTLVKQEKQMPEYNVVVTTNDANVAQGFLDEAEKLNDDGYEVKAEVCTDLKADLNAIEEKVEQMIDAAKKR
ncbi:MAG: hypothetical protein HC866_17865 [Leptolyngbyaceae cyanobacterium RU_5_1]|nr:hypothetical protein [Leptolyngbyaceae cyanobacterium RU_5_1]